MKLYEEYEDIQNILYKYSSIKNPVINSDGTVDAQEVNLYLMALSKIPVQFRKTGYFNIGNNLLTSLKGSPVQCESFNCYSNKLSSLKYSPKIVDGDFCCNNNSIISLSYGPQIVEGDYSFSDNLIIDLKGISCEFQL